VYLAMDELGREKVAVISRLDDSQDKWREIVGTARSYGFSGIQMTPSLYEEQLGLDLLDIPAFLKQLRLTYHIGGTYSLVTPDDCKLADAALDRAFSAAVAAGCEDVSMHPPLVMDGDVPSRRVSRSNLSALIRDWLPRFASAGITLSLETHVAPGIFVLEGLEDYRHFVQRHPGLGVLIDVSHNYYDGYAIIDIVEKLAGLKVTGLHLSDAARGVGLTEGTHLPIGGGTVDFASLLSTFGDKRDICAALEVRGSVADIHDSVTRLTQLLTRCE